MTLFDIAFKNIKRNFYNYFIYFVSMVFSIMIYYVFTSIQYNEEVVSQVMYQAQITSLFKTSSVIVAIFAIIFIWYSNSFFTKKRKKEVGLYSLMGVKKKQIGRMLFYENIIMGIIALATGIFLGTLLSKLFAMLLLKLMGLSVAVEFAIFPKAILNTVITFLILFLITSIHGYTIVYRFKLIDLFSAEKKGEKEPKGSLLGAIFAVVLIGFGYGLHLKASKYVSLQTLMTTLVTVVAGTYFLFSFLTIFIIKISKKNKKKYYKGINMIGTSQLLHRIKSSSRTLATIAVLSATTLTAMGVTASFYYDLVTSIENDYPFSYAYMSEAKDLDEKIENTISKYPQHEILDRIDYEFISMDGKFSHLNEGKTINIISESGFNEIIKFREMNPIELDKSSDAIYIDQMFIDALEESYKDKEVSLNINDEMKVIKIEYFESYNLLNSYMGKNILVVKDKVYNELFKHGTILEGTGYIVDNQRTSSELTQELEALIQNVRSESDSPRTSFRSFYDVFSHGLITNGMIVFIGTFLGLVFLLSTGSIIFFKQLSEANDDKIRYDILRKIGVNKKEVKLSISKQMLYVFLLPLLVGITHSLVAVSILEKFYTINLITPVGLSIGIFTVIYMIYYFLTVNSYTKILNSK